jgi:CheY-like chemotaxis protein
MFEKIILVIEDSIPNRNISCQILGKLGFQTIEATSGVEALKIVEILDEHQIKIDGFVSDIMMPEMDGIQFLTQLRTFASYDKVPFIFMTASTDKEFVLKARSMNVDGYLLKPLTFDKIQKKLASMFPDHKFPILKKTGS